MSRLAGDASKLQGQYALGARNSWGKYAVGKFEEAAGLERKESEGQVGNGRT